jgi:hypothetical protein
MAFNFLRSAALAAVVVSLGACASAAKPELMSLTAATATAKPATADHKAYHAMSVQQVQGGNETNPMWASDVSNPDFQKALETSLRAFDYLVMDGGMSKYKVTASIVDVQKPLMGLDLSVTMKVRYSVLNEQGVVAFDDTIGATGTATMGEAFAAVERLRIAIEKAAKANIEAFLTRLATDLK